MSKQQKIPHLIYESLPYLYMGSGVFIMLNLLNAWGMFSGLMLLSAGILVWWTRWTYRRALNQSAVLPTRDATVRSAISQIKRRDAGLVQLVWSDDFNCGNAAIDTQHRKLFELSNTLLNAIFEKQPKLDVELLLDDLVRNIANHFSTEEALLAQTDHPHILAHQDIHRKLQLLCKNMALRFHNDELTVGDLFKFIAFDVMSEHMLKEDIKCFTNIRDSRHGGRLIECQSALAG